MRSMQYKFVCSMHFCRDKHAILAEYPKYLVIYIKLKLLFNSVSAQIIQVLSTHARTHLHCLLPVMIHDYQQKEGISQTIPLKKHKRK